MECNLVLGFEFKSMIHGFKIEELWEIGSHFKASFIFKTPNSLISNKILSFCALLLALFRFLLGLNWLKTDVWHLNSSFFYIKYNFVSLWFKINWIFWNAFMWRLTQYKRFKFWNRISKCYRRYTNEYLISDG